jgi:hypothetical protein
LKDFAFRVRSAMLWRLSSVRFIAWGAELPFAPDFDASAAAISSAASAASAATTFADDLAASSDDLGFFMGGAGFESLRLETGARARLRGAADIRWGRGKRIQMHFHSGYRRARRRDPVVKVAYPVTLGDSVACAAPTLLPQA